MEVAHNVQNKSRGGDEAAIRRSATRQKSVAAASAARVESSNTCCSSALKRLCAARTAWHSICSHGTSGGNAIAMAAVVQRVSVRPNREEQRTRRQRGLPMADELVSQAEPCAALAACEDARALPACHLAS